MQSRQNRQPAVTPVTWVTERRAGSGQEIPVAQVHRARAEAALLQKLEPQADAVGERPRPAAHEDRQAAWTFSSGAARSKRPSSSATSSSSEAIAEQISLATSPP
jgi:hypothetical protein